MASLNLTEDGELQVQAYLRFAKLKRDQHVREVVSTISDFKGDHLRPGDMYNYKELSAMWQELEQSTRELMDKEIQNAYHANALLVKILLSQAQSQGLELLVDTNSLENEFLLKQISASEKTALSRPASDFIRRNTNLGRLGTVASVTTQDPLLLKERDALKAELAAAKERMAKLQEEVTKVMRDRTDINNKLNALKDELAARGIQLSDKDASLSKLRKDLDALSTSKAGLSSAEAERLQKQAGGLAGQLAALQEEVKGLKSQLALKEKELRAANDALNGKLQDSKQFQQMKAMMQAKAQEVAQLRKRLERYEPPNVPSADKE